jgi:hypothetical protein
MVRNKIAAFAPTVALAGGGAVALSAAPAAAATPTRSLEETSR